MTFNKNRVTIVSGTPGTYSHTKLKEPWLSLARVIFIGTTLMLVGVVTTTYLTEMAPSFEIGLIGLRYEPCEDIPEEEQCVEIVQVITDSPADKADIRAGQYFVELDGVSPALETVSGPVGSTAHLIIADPNGTTYEYELIREPGWSIANKVIWIEIGLSHTQTAGIILIVNNLILVVSLGIGLFIALRRSDDWMALLAALAVIAVGTWLSDYTFWFTTFTSTLWKLTSFHYLIMTVLGLAFILLMPDGKMVPQWGWALLVFALLFNTSTARENAIYLVLTFILFMIGLGAQWHQYRTVATPEQRQQRKWILFGALLIVLTRGFVETSWAFMQLSEEITTTMLYYRAITQLISQVVFLALPISLLFSAMHYRLWDIDAAINRTLVYGFLTGSLGLIFLGGFYGLQSLLSSFLGEGQATLSAGVAGAAVFGLFRPTRNQLRRYVDRNVYGIELDYLQALDEHKKQIAVVKSSVGDATHFGDYIGMDLIGRGGMGEVYRGQHENQRKTAAIKILPSDLADDKDILNRFRREAETISQLKHPNIVSLLDYGEKDGKPFMIMEYIEGQNLRDIIETKKKFTLEESLSILRDIGSALDYAHNLGIVHRDIKPSNVMVNERNGETTATLMDFGIAKMVTNATRLTKTGGIMGTLDYISPDQIRGADDVDLQTDQYSFAVMVYEMLVGTLPFIHDAPVSMIMAHLNEPAPNAREKAPEISHETANAITRAMAKEPELRFPTIGHFVANLK